MLEAASCAALRQISRERVNMNATARMLFLFAATASLLVRADSLTEIAEFAERICNQSISGNESSTTIVANANADVKGLAKVLGLSVEGGGLVKHDGTHYDGIPKDKLSASIPTPAQCKVDLAKVLIDERKQLARVASTEDHH
jgi:hypothetical protein